MKFQCNKIKHMPLSYLLHAVVLEPCVCVFWGKLLIKHKCKWCTDYEQKPLSCETFSKILDGFLFCFIGGSGEVKQEPPPASACLLLCTVTVCKTEL